MSRDPAPDAPVSLHDAGDLVGFINRVTKGHLAPLPDPTQQQRQAQRETLASTLLRGILHHPRFQAIEAAWRAAYMLIRGLETDTDLHLYLLDVTLPELVSEMGTVQKELRKKGHGDSSRATTPSPKQNSTPRCCDDWRRWEVLWERRFWPRHSYRAKGSNAPGRICGTPRRPDGSGWRCRAFLVRLPYGKSTSAIDSFPFEEMPVSEHGSYLWGNPSFFCAFLLGKSYLQQGWGMTRLSVASTIFPCTCTRKMANR
ncbi:MAG: type VI secretion system contractile sheath large subunit [Ignavibacteriota bacterium]